MSSISNLLSRGARTLQNQLGGPTCVLNGITYPCSFSTLTRGDTLELGGWQAEVTLTVHIRKADLASVTVDSTLITVDSETITADASGQQPHPGKIASTATRRYRVARVREDGASATWALDLTDPTK